MELVIKRWGRSFGAVIPMEKAKKLNLKENDVLKASVSRRKTPIEETFGLLKMKTPTSELLAESDKECWDE
jgi:antitoxin component of MazEF toxin-antitoxin module